MVATSTVCTVGWEVKGNHSQYMSKHNEYKYLATWQAGYAGLPTMHDANPDGARHR